MNRRIYLAIHLETQKWSSLERLHNTPIIETTIIVASSGHPIPAVASGSIEFLVHDFALHIAIPGVILLQGTGVPSSP